MAAAAPAAAPPAAATAAPGVEVRDHPVFGRCAFAARPFAAGEVIVDEAPLVICAEGADAGGAANGGGATPGAAKGGGAAPALAWLSRALSEDAAAARAACRGALTPAELRKLCVCYLAFCAGDDAARAGVLQGMLNDGARGGKGVVSGLGTVTAVRPARPRCQPPALKRTLSFPWRAVGPDAEDAHVVQRVRAAVGFIAASLAPRAAADGALRDPPSDPATVARILLAFELNAHAVGGRCAAAARRGRDGASPAAALWVLSPLCSRRCATSLPARSSPAAARSSRSAPSSRTRAGSPTRCSSRRAGAATTSRSPTSRRGTC
jgi:hypothetical protein